MNLNFHPAPGMGELMAGWFSVPQNPITAAVRYTPRIGELVNAHFSLPENPLVNPHVLGMRGCGCQSREGMGAVDFGSAWQSVTDTASGALDSVRGWGVNPWIIGGGLAVAALLLFRPGGSEYRRAMSSARAKYKDEVSRIRSRYPRVAGRARRAAEAF